jgi:hypothetical protein
MITHTYVIADFVGLLVDSPDLYHLDLEIADSITQNECDGILREGDSFKIYFDHALSVGEESALDAVIAAHTGVAPLTEGGEDPHMIRMSRAPTEDDDGYEGITLGSFWIDTTDESVYILTNDEYGNITWKEFLFGAGGLQAHASTHIRGGSDEIDGDKLDIDFTPASYTPSTNPPEVDHEDHLSAHLAGIDDYVGDLGQEKLDIDDHRTLRHLIHFIDDGPGGGFASGAYCETLPAADPFPTSIIWYVSTAKTEKIVELNITRNANKTPSVEEWKMYDINGSTVLTTVTDSISYSGVFETSRTRTIA